MTNVTKHYFIAITPNTRNVITRTDKCLVCGDDTYWSDDPDPVCKTCASDPERIARMLAEARDALELSEASKTLAANELRELRAALAQARALLTEWTNTPFFENQDDYERWVSDYGRRVSEFIGLERRRP